MVPRSGKSNGKCHPAHTAKKSELSECSLLKNSYWKEKDYLRLKKSANRTLVKFKKGKAKFCT